MTFLRKTVKDRVRFEGLGLHSGSPVSVTVNAGDAGIWFRQGSKRLEAIPANVSDTSRCTRLGSISTIEHLMSALAGLEITDAEIEVKGDELPGMDGSAAPYVTGLLEVGFEDLGEKTLGNLFSRVFLQEDPALKIAIGKGDGHWRYVYDLGERWPGEQSFELADVVGDYVSQVAPARTLVLAEEIPAVQALGLGKGLDERSVLIVGQSGYENEARFEDEPARHKLLDLIGDLYLAGVPLRLLNVVAERSGHRANVRAADLLYRAVRS